MTLTDIYSELMANYLDRVESEYRRRGWLIDYDGEAVTVARPGNRERFASGRRHENRVNALSYCGLWQDLSKREASHAMQSL